MVKTSSGHQTKQCDLSDDPEKESRLSAGSRLKGFTKMKKNKEWKKVVASGHSYTVNGPEWGESEMGESDDSMDINQGSVRIKEKRDDEVTGGRSKKLRSNVYEERAQEVNVNEFKIILRFEEEKGILPMSPVKLTSILKNQVGDIIMAKVLRDGNLLIACKSEEQRQRAGKMKEIGKNKVVSTNYIGQGTKGAKGVIWGVPTSITTDEIKANLKGGSVKNVRRLQVNRDGTKRDSESILLEFVGEMLPRKVTLGFMSYNVREYVPMPMRCYNCQRFGHTAKTCKGKRRCARCGEDHSFEECNHKEQPRCCSCGGNHSVAYGGCEVLRKEKKIQQVRTQGKLTYAEAVRIVNQRGGNGERDSTEIHLNKSMESEQANEGKMLVDMRKLITFIAGVINATMGVKSKTERIQIITKAAVNHLDFRGLTWEEVRNDLSIQTSQEIPNG